MSGRQLRRGRWGKGYKTEGRPPSGLIKSITFSFGSCERFSSSSSISSSSCSFPFSSLFLASRQIRITVPFSPPPPPPLLYLPFLLRGQLHRSRLFTLILILLPAVRRRLRRRKPLLSLPSSLPPSFSLLYPFSASSLPSLILPRWGHSLALILRKFAK
ncbi:hypothetical protein ALC56_09725 [Trachymyrmex septentrionalis]|uniref:Uncharacterized protein n=1 Tax=Trachymyrmex septentrionalis TaxID=34720 RepID=A0A195F787_9HYME|nr:hypothetical protein ALC56_09725 [Trachymyrmex septentrionalis]